ncbi:type II toxin-antitoxin system HicB family antitoxin [Thermosynechococcaceae cyanobacterium BACA0444]|uniref:Type II toxin-antitoxin system HicB family antitoxin n=1 Tax=Pseudocalidococcus azoricus BACA0444 TaxID=2918990 RepID=A0AAE4JWD6_9CYAN|nr:hypothetical protein [Pseudocalidococcus azoricus]MDS3860951.1 type II toxin-antitoxin system HicB family antitoxin [Pseudocalidococcus azoricus BACA0444]
MLNDYLMAAMKIAKYQVLEDNSYFGCIPGFDGLWSNARTLEQCRDELLSGLDDWVLLGLKMGHLLPVVDGIELNLDLTPEAS